MNLKRPAADRFRLDVSLFRNILISRANDVAPADHNSPRRRNEQHLASQSEFFGCRRG